MISSALPSSRRGQGATEYLVLLAVVLIVALVGVGLLGYFPGLAGDAQLAQSNAYWSGDARPFMIVGAQESPSSNLTLVLENAETDVRLLTNVSIGGDGVNASFVPSSAQQYFTPGYKQVLSIPLWVNGAPVSGANPACISGGTYNYYINLTYTNGDGTITGQKEFGTKTLNGKCS